MTFPVFPDSRETWISAHSLLTELLDAIYSVLDENAIMAVQCLELLYVALFAWMVGKHVFVTNVVRTLRFESEEVQPVGFRMATSNSVNRL